MPENMPTLKALRRLFDKHLHFARLADQVRLKREWNKLDLRSIPPENNLPENLAIPVKRLLARAAEAEKRSLKGVAGNLVRQYPENLPVSSRHQEIVELIKNNQLLIVAGATGSGKTTQLPKMALDAGCGTLGRIGCTQPRRLAASSLARRAAHEMQTEFGGAVGYKVRFDDHTSENTVVKFMTDGILLAETREDPDLLQYDCIMLDEVHERSLNIDFLLGYLKKLLMRRKNLKVIISSATLESEKLAEFFDHAPFVEIEGRTFPIEDYYMEPEKDEELADHVARAVEFISELDHHGDILVFLPGEREIRDCSEVLTGRRLKNSEVLPLFGRLSSADQNRIFNPGNLRRIVLATNVAETSLTIPGIKYVVDSGLVRISRYNPRTRIQELQVEFVSQASVRQRRGRCGRLEDGICVHLYSEDDVNRAMPYTDPEIKRSSLAGVILQMASLKLGAIEKFPLVDPPAMPLIRDGYRTLSDLGAIDENNRLTPCGWTLSELPLDPQLGRMLIEGNLQKVLRQTVIIAACLSIPDVRERPFEKTQAADTAHKQWASEKSDFSAMLNLYDVLEKVYNENKSNSALRRYALKNYLNYRRVREWRNLVEDLSSIALDREWSDIVSTSPLTDYDSDALHKVLLAGLPRQLGFYDSEQKNYFEMSGKRFKIFPGSGLAKRKSMPQWLFCFALVETSQVFARSCAEAKPEWLMQVAPHLCKKVYDQAHYSPQSGFVSARERITCGRLLIHPGRQRHYGPVNPAEARSIFIKDALVAGELDEHRIKGIKWLENFLQNARKVRKFELKMRRFDMLYNAEEVTEFFEKTLPENFYSVQEIRNHWQRFHKNYPVPENVLWEHESLPGDPELDYPDTLVFGGVEYPLEYRFDPGTERDGITLIADEESVKLLPEWALEPLVPGFLAEKLEFYLKSLPRQDRQKLAPMSSFISDFVERWKNKRIFNERSLSEVLADELSKYNITINSNAFAGVSLPEYLKMKLLIIDDSGREIEFLTEVPMLERSTSQISRALPGMQAFCAPPDKCFPVVPMLPCSVKLPGNSGSEAYPALYADEQGLVGSAVYLKKAEAVFRHDQGLSALLKLQLAGLFSAIKRDFKLNNNDEKLFFKATPEHMEYNWKELLMQSVILEALGDSDSRWQIRSKAAFDSARENARCRFADVADEQFATLNGVFEAVARIKTLLKKVPASNPGRCDIEEQLEFYFRPGFLQFPVWHERYKRYLRGIELRLQRLIANPRQDAQKFQLIEEYVPRIKLAVENVPELALAPLLYDFVLLFDEMRLSVFAPEVRSVQKVSPEILRKAWENMRY